MLKAATGLFARLGWQVAWQPPNAGVIGEPADAGLLDRETKGEAVAVARLRAALRPLNPPLPAEATPESTKPPEQWKNLRS